MTSLHLLPSESISELVESYQRAFPLGPPLSKHILLTDSVGDIWSAQRIVRILYYRRWNEISFDEFDSCGATELMSHLSKEAYSYYLPGLHTSVLRSLQVVPQTRLHEVSTMMLLPTTPDYQDVWNWFGDGLFDDWGTSFFMKSTKELIVKINFVHESFTPAQRQCLARYIEIVESYGVKNPDAEFLAILKKFADFWRGGSDASASGLAPGQSSHH